MSQLSGKTIVLLRTSSIARIAVYKHLRHTCGVRIILVHPTVPIASFDGCYDVLIVHDTYDIDELEVALFATLKDQHGILENDVDAILSFDEYGVYPAAVLSERRNKRPIPLPSRALQQTSIKSAFRQFCTANDISSPKAFVIDSPRSVDMNLASNFAQSGLQFPVVIKPSPGAGSLLAKLCQSLEELTAHAHIMWDVLSHHPDTKHFNALGTPVHLLVEEYIGGQEVDIDCAIENGVIRFMAISDNFEVQPPYFTESGGLCPTRLGMTEQDALKDLLQSFLVAHGSSCHGVLHFEAKYDFTRQRAYVIEVNGRMGSAETSTMILTAYGVQLGECLVRIGLGLPLDVILPPLDGSTNHNSIIMNKPKAFCASVNLYPNAEGVVRHIGVPVADKSLVGFNVSAAPGSLVALPPKSFSLLCWMVAQGSTSEEAIEHIERLAQEFVQDITSAQ